MRLPKIGTHRTIQNRPGYLNLSKIVEWVQKGRLDINNKIDIFTLIKARCVSIDKCKYGLKILARGDFSDF